MDTNKPLTHVKAGLLIAAALVLFSIIVQLLGLSDNTSVGLLTYVILIAGLIIVINLYGKANNYSVTFGNLFAYGFKTTAVFTILFIGFLIIFNLLFPELKEKAFEVAQQELEKQDDFSEDQIEQSLSIMKRFYWVGIIGGTMLGFVILGAIGSLIGAAVTKKRPATPFDQPTQ